MVDGGLLGQREDVHRFEPEIGRVAEALHDARARDEPADAQVDLGGERRHGPPTGLSRAAHEQHRAARVVVEIGAGSRHREEEAQESAIPP